MKNLFLIFIPFTVMGIIQTVFALLSLLVFQDNTYPHFLGPAIPMLMVSLFAGIGMHHINFDSINFRDSFLFSSISWFGISLLGSFPIMLSAHTSFTDAVFESTSAISTTGATILTGLDQLPRTLLLYRQFLQWLGGLGVIIFMIAIIPMMNTGGMRLLRTEIPGPMRDEKLSPRVYKTAHYLWLMYLLMTLLCTLSYYICGMSMFDAIGHSFSTVSTGGFSTHDKSLAWFKKDSVIWVADVFMMLGAINFGLHYRSLIRQNARLYWKDEETKTFSIVVLVLTLIVSASLYFSYYTEGFYESVKQGLFHLISFITSTGFTNGSLAKWPHAVLFILVFAGFLGGCSGSTAGGNKIVRSIITLKMIGNELKSMAHPRQISMIKYNHKKVDDNIINSISSFFGVVMFLTLIFTLILMATGLDFWSAFTAVEACLNVLGPAFGELGSNFQPLTDTATWTMTLAMILGRLEYFTVLAILLPSFWRF